MYTRAVGRLRRNSIVQERSSKAEETRESSPPERLAKWREQEGRPRTTEAMPAAELASESWCSAARAGPCSMSAMQREGLGKPLMES